jgi:riboflavin synthase alpha subunit
MISSTNFVRGLTKVASSVNVTDQEALFILQNMKYLPKGVISLDGVWLTVVGSRAAECRIAV